MSEKESETKLPEAVPKIDQDAKPAAHVPKRTICDPDGDRQIIAGPDGSQEIFTVSSYAMSLACKPWKAMLGKGSRFVEASISQTTPIPFPEDNVEALAVLLNACHLEFTRVPVVIELEQLYNLAVICDKYDASKLVVPWLHRWTGDNRISSMSSAFLAERLFISWAFGDQKAFRDIAEFLIKNMRRLTGGKFMLDGKLIGDDRMPPNVFENIVTARDAAINGILDTCYSYSNLLMPGQGGICRARNTLRMEASARRKQCDSLILGSWLRSLVALKLWPGRQDSTSYTSCLQDLMADVWKIDVQYYPHFPASYGDCNREGPDIKTKITDCANTALKTATRKVMAAHANHLKIQSEKCSVKVDSPSAKSHA